MRARDNSWRFSPLPSVLTSEEGTFELTTPEAAWLCPHQRGHLRPASSTT